MRYKTVVLAVAMFGVLFTAERSSDAQKQYMDALKAKYPKAANQIDIQKCGVCHGKTKIQRSEFAKSLEAALGGKKIKQVAAINAALDKVAAQNSGVPNKTYGDLLGGGQLPPPYKAPPQK